MNSLQAPPIFSQPRPLIMGILNVTPDSFSDGDNYMQEAAAVKHAESMIAAGADIIDIGGESTRPGAAQVAADEEIRRVVPLVKAVSALGGQVSVDTSKPQVMLAAAEAGAGMLNDVRALTEPGALAAAAQTGLPVCLMHMQGQPKTMQADPQYQDVEQQVTGFLLSRAQACIEAGIAQDQICLDPGFGFGKTLAHNIALLNGLERLRAHGYPVLAGLSRKSMLGLITDQPVDKRLPASLAVALIAMQKGADIVRVHDVEATVDVKKIYLATR